MAEKITDEVTLALLDSCNKAFEETVRVAKANMYKSKQAALDQWARDNAEFKVGDIIASDDIIIKVEKVVGRHSQYYGTKTLYAEYIGKQLTKKLQPRKDGQKTSIYGDGRKITKL